MKRSQELSSAPPDTAVLTTKRIVAKVKPVLVVVHATEWQFLDGEDVEVSDAAVLGWQAMLQMDPGLVALADFPFGWQAWRDTPHSAWYRAPIDEDE